MFQKPLYTDRFIISLRKIYNLIQKTTLLFLKPQQKLPANARWLKAEPAMAPGLVCTTTKPTPKFDWNEERDKALVENYLKR